jgi:adenylosuccinate synthase
MKGWRIDVAGILEHQIPSELSSYISFLEKELRVPITLISTGPDRTQTIHRKKAA